MTINCFNVDWLNANRRRENTRNRAGERTHDESDVQHAGLVRKFRESQIHAITCKLYSEKPLSNNAEAFASAACERFPNSPLLWFTLSVESKTFDYGFVTAT
jgi:hypothetical protein